MLDHPLVLVLDHLGQILKEPGRASLLDGLGRHAWRWPPRLARADIFTTLGCNRVIRPREVPWLLQLPIKRLIFFLWVTLNRQNRKLLIALVSHYELSRINQIVIDLLLIMLEFRLQMSIKLLEITWQQSTHKLGAHKQFWPLRPILLQIWNVLWGLYILWHLRDNISSC